MRQAPFNWVETILSSRRVLITERIRHSLTVERSCTGLRPDRNAALSGDRSHPGRADVHQGAQTRRQGGRVARQGAPGTRQSGSAGVSRSTWNVPEGPELSCCECFVGQGADETRRDEARSGEPGVAGNEAAPELTMGKWGQASER
jgi:hypothetical protein